MISGFTFISAPFRSPLRDQEQRNTQKVMDLCYALTCRGFACYAPHSTILMGGYGSDQVAAERAYGMRAVLQILAYAHNSGGFLVICVGSGSNSDPVFSEGTRMELEYWTKLNSLTAGGAGLYDRIIWYDWNSLIQIESVEVARRLKIPVIQPKV
jgi:hypothetical protein